MGIFKELDAEDWTGLITIMSLIVLIVMLITGQMEFFPMFLTTFIVGIAGKAYFKLNGGKEGKDE